jgi:hypothetical protein
VNSEMIQIIRRADEMAVEAQLLSNLEATDLLLIERQWESPRQIVHQRLLAAGVDRRRWPQSLHWNWKGKAPLLGQLAIGGYGIVHGSEWQAVCLVDCVSYSSRLPGHLGRPLVYLDFIETAPWNWTIPELGQFGVYGACGMILFDRVVQRSKEEGFRGRVGLHALPQAERFYEDRCGMVPLGKDASKQDLMYFERVL